MGEDPLRRGAQQAQHFGRALRRLGGEMDVEDGAVLGGHGKARHQIARHPCRYGQHHRLVWRHHLPAIGPFQRRHPIAGELQPAQAAPGGQRHALDGQPAHRRIDEGTGQIRGSHARRAGLAALGQRFL